MQFFRHTIPDVIEIIPPKFGDHRGFFSETFKRTTFADNGVDSDWIQDNQSFSSEVGTVRGLHFQVPPLAQAKLIRVLRGAILDVAVDLRAGSPYYGKSVAVELSAAKWNQLFVPRGFAHGFMTTEPDTEVLYKVDAQWSREHERAIAWNDPTLAIAWPEQAATLSAKDDVAMAFSAFETPFVYNGTR